MRICIMAAALLLAGCSQSVQQYQAETPKLSLKEFFLGSGKAYGVLHDWRGKQTLRFTADLCGEWQGDKGDLYEVFYFSDGRVEQRHWQLTQFADGRITGSAGDVVGAANGQLAGNSLYWQYVLRIPYNGDELDVTVKDWLYLVDQQNLINRTTMHKFGIKVAELTLSIQQLNPQASCSNLKQQVAELASNS
ncbi:DUF3833 domain-containing protein [Rheinheimera sp. UJ51]|uniref:DUF3833 domain-containing protein n=1 Tax=Gammaproteobacteria TaxID=1236 RepID=UPI001E532FFC|nr:MULTISPECIES: DUF3833 domain-containing protein [unclassified Rheinheimera]MCC5450900.1 DUF3833 domain-containing protein [Rheinheimera sp. UJ51]MCF4008426.1 DUF3833 domain-containing protein [Rheinheimera sp. UJ63]